MTPSSNPSAVTVKAFRGTIAHCVDVIESTDRGDSRGIEFFADGLLVINDGHVAAVGDARRLLPTLPAKTTVVNRQGQWIVPGFIDTHVHFPQTDIIASYGTQLLDWLEQYAFPVERRFSNRAYCQEVSTFFIDELLRNGTTTAAVYATVHAPSADELFAAAHAKNMRIVAGKVLMDRHCPPDLQDDPKSGYELSQGLIEKWHGKGRLSYGITPRFAPTSSEEQLRLAGRLAAEHPTTHIQTHVAENKAEVAWVRELFPNCRSYLDVYEQCGLVRQGAVFGHGIYLDDADRKSLSGANAAIAFCPTSNLFLGSGLFDLASATESNVRVGFGSDVGGGTSFSLLRTAAEGYKVSQLQGASCSPCFVFYLLTLGGARALHLDHAIGNFAKGKEADFVVLDPSCTPLMQRRFEYATTTQEQLFALIMLGDDRLIRETYLLGERAGQRDRQ